MEEKFNLASFNEAASKLYGKLSTWFVELVAMLPNIIIAAIVLVASIFLSKYLKKVIEKGLRRSGVNGTVTSLMSNIAVAAFMILSLFIMLNILNLDDALTALLGTAGVAGLAVGLALQDPMVNLFSGVIMSVREYYRLGDLVETNGYFGSIKKINLRSTVILTPKGQEVIIPNKEVVQNPLVNYSNNGKRRVDISCGVAYGDDLEKVQKIAIEAVENHVDFQDAKPIELFFNEFGDSSINFTLRFWHTLTAQRDYLDKQSKAIIAIKKAFDKEGITIPFPIRTLDFGVVGGLPINEIYPPNQIFNLPSIGNGSTSGPANGSNGSNGSKSTAGFSQNSANGSANIS